MNLDRETVYITAAIVVALIVFVSFPISTWIGEQGSRGSSTNPSKVNCRSVAEQIRSEHNRSVTNFTCYPGNEEYAKRLDVPTEVRDLSDLSCICTFVDANGSRRLLPIWQTQGVSGAKVK